MSVRKLLRKKSPTTFSQFFLNSSIAYQNNYLLQENFGRNVETIFSGCFFVKYYVYRCYIVFFIFSANQNCRWWGSSYTKGQKQTTFAKARHNYRTFRRLFKLFRLSNWNWAVIQPPMCFQFDKLKSNSITVIAFRAFTVYLNSQDNPDKKQPLWCS